MAVKTVGIGHQNFEQLIQANCFYIDKTGKRLRYLKNKADALNHKSPVYPADGSRGFFVSRCAFSCSSTAEPHAQGIRENERTG